MEHHSNLVPWHLLSQRKGAKLVEVKPGADGTLSEDALDEAIGPRTKLVAVTHVSNLLGTVNNLKFVAGAAHDAGALFLVDGAQALGHLPVNVQEIGCDLYAGSGHKMLGPTGTGFLYGRYEILDSFETFFGGGDMIEEVFFDRSTYREIPARLEAGTPNIAGVIGLGAAVEFLTSLGMKAVRSHDRALMEYALDRLQDLPWIEVYGPCRAAMRSGLVSFNIEGIHAHDAGTLLDDMGIAVRTGHMCAQPLARHLGISGCVRASFALYNDARDVDLLAAGLERVARYFGLN
jgi:cysteine desulfurase/selenocysteine lyase